MGQVPIQLSSTLNNLKVHVAPLWVARGASSNRRHNTSRRQGQRSPTKSFQSVLAEPLGRSREPEHSRRDKEDESLQRDRLGEILQRPSIPASGFEPKAKRKVAMHVGYVGTAFRGIISEPGLDCTAVPSCLRPHMAICNLIKQPLRLQKAVLHHGVCILQSQGLLEWAKPPHVLFIQGNGLAFGDGQGLTCIGRQGLPCTGRHG